MALAFRVLLFFLMLWLVNSSQNVTGVSLRFKGLELSNSTSQVCLRDIGVQPALPLPTPDTAEGPAMVCTTTNPTCCRAADGTQGGGAGEWTLNGVQAEGTHNMPLPLIYRSRGTGLVRLNVQTGAVVTGQFCCTIPDSSNVTRTLCVDVTLDSSVCNPLTGSTSSTVTSTASPGPPATVTTSRSLHNTTTDSTAATASTAPADSTATTTVPVSTAPADSTADTTTVTIALAGVVALCVSVILLLLCLVAALCYKLTHQARNTAVTDTALHLSDNQAYGKADESNSEDPAQVQQSTELLYECIPEYTPPSVQHSRSDSSSSEHYYY